MPLNMLEKITSRISVFAWASKLQQLNSVVMSLGMNGANSTEFDENAEYPAVIFMPEISKTHLGGTMRLGSRPTIWQVDDCKIKRLYGTDDSVDERHRHRYEVNPDIIENIEQAGLKFVGKDETGQRCEIFELEDHVYYVGVNIIQNSNHGLVDLVPHSSAY